MANRKIKKISTRFTVEKMAEKAIAIAQENANVEASDLFIQEERAGEKPYRWDEIQEREETPEEKAVRLLKEQDKFNEHLLETGTEFVAAHSRSYRNKDGIMQTMDCTDSEATLYILMGQPNKPQLTATGKQSKGGSKLAEETM